MDPDKPIDTMNLFMVGAGTEHVRTLRDSRLPMTKEEALNLAAWLVAVADDSKRHSRFNAILSAVEENRGL